MLKEELTKELILFNMELMEELIKNGNFIAMELSALKDTTLFLILKMEASTMETISLPGLIMVVLTKDLELLTYLSKYLKLNKK